MIVYFNTVKRKRPVKEAGELVMLNWENKRVLRSLPLYPSDPDIEHDPNPRGNSRGGKGMLISGKQLVVGTHHSLLFFDLNLNLINIISNPLFANIHEICQVEETFWVSSTTIDAAVRVDRHGRTLSSFWPREEESLQRQFGFFPMEIDKNADNRLRYLQDDLSTKPGHTHLNSVFQHQGRVCVLLNHQGLIIEVGPELKVMVRDDDLMGAHSPVFSSDGSRILVCDTKRRQILMYDSCSGRRLKTLALTGFSELARLITEYPDQPFNRCLFLRGLEILSQDRVLVGFSPAGIAEVDLAREQLVDLFCYSDDVGDAVHGLVHSEVDPGEADS